MKKDNMESVEQDKAVDSWVQEAQLSADDLDAVIGGLSTVAVTCGGTYVSCGSTYSGAAN